MLSTFYVFTRQNGMGKVAYTTYTSEHRGTEIWVTELWKVNKPQKILPSLSSTFSHCPPPCECSGPPIQSYAMPLLKEGRL